VHRAWLGHWSGALAACSGEMVATHWVEVVAVEASASGSSDVGLESLVVVSETESEALALASAAGSSGVACKTS
jgi:alkanesulfonate monooxygenase SsuD/methylene tetrahydromethanopterin reductase-like flavin-dependent oxidoreductase (luciferase family)